MAQTREGAAKAAAKKIGVSLDIYYTNVNRGLKWCFDCRRWRERECFGTDRSRWDGLKANCRRCSGARGADYRRETYVPVPGPKIGRRFKQARDGDKLQARRRVNYLVDAGLLPDPDAVPCTDCGHAGPGRRHEYDHHLGYAPENHEQVEATCSRCHAQRELARGTRGEVKSKARRRSL